jgi:endonuclease-3
MTKAEKVRLIMDILDALYPDPAISLDRRDPYTHLVAVLLSAQCTDVRVNQVTPQLFVRADDPATMTRLEIAEIAQIIRPCGLAPRKSKAIWELSRLLVERHNGQVPQTLEELETLPGIGHKSAQVVLGQNFGIPSFAVDTHVHRLAYRWTLSTGKNVERTEKDLKRLFPKEHWNKLHNQFIYFGREHCPARGHNPNECPICKQIGRRILS